MRLRVPSYYKDFHCIADQCKDSCCIGWEIDIDDDTYEYYCSIEGAFGKCLREHMKNGAEKCFRLQKGRCPFLNESNLCDICIELGEEALSEVCTEYPRFTMEYGDVIEKCMALSCEEVGRLVFESDAPFTYEEMIQDDAYSYEEEDELDDEESDLDEDSVDMGDEVASTLEDDLGDEESEDYIAVVEATREKLFTILKDRRICIEERIARGLTFCELVQQLVNEMRYTEALQMAMNDTVEEKKAVASESQLYEYCRLRIRTFEELEVLDDEWREYLVKMKQVLLSETMSGNKYQQALYQMKEQLGKREYEYEHLMNYFVFRYFMRAVYDYDMLGKMKLAVISFLCIRDMDLIRYWEQDCTYTLADRIDIARIYSKEVEHSDDNIEALLESFEFEACYKTDQMILQCLYK